MSRILTNKSFTASLVAGAGFAVGAIFNAYQQTNGFTNFCHYNIIETLAWGIGGAAAATSAAIMLVSGVGMVGMGLQGFALGLSGLGISTSLTTSLFIAGTTTAAWSTTAMAWLFTSLSPSSQSATLSRGVKAAQELLSESRESVRSPGKVWENSGNNEDAIQWFNRISNPDTIEPHPNPNIPGGLQANIFGSDGRVFYRPFSSSLPKVPTIDADD